MLAFLPCSDGWVLWLVCLSVAIRGAGFFCCDQHLRVELRGVPGLRCCTCHLTQKNGGSSREAEVEMPYRPNYLPDHEDTSFRLFCFGPSNFVNVV